uniref:Ankyrin-2 n=2 Tax=Cajanus cajan TaxID=3821 RepID=A0A151QWN5_CAJCA|nr:Ankyrin-2 [Cajanus cajan]
MELCVPLHKHALEGNWAAAKRILDEDGKLRHAAIAKGWPTVLHVAAGANHVDFVDQLLQVLDKEHMALQDMKGNTAFCFAAASGNMDIARLLLHKNSFLPLIRGGNGRTPLHFAAMQGRCHMTRFLYDLTKPVFQDQDCQLLFFTSIHTANYELALKMAREREELAYARDENDDTALHLLAQNQKPLESYCHCPEHQNPIMINPGMKQHVFFQLVNFLWNTILRHKDFSESIKIISEPSQLLFDAAEVGNFGFLSEFISAHPSLIWEVDNQNQSIIHTAVSHRHASIFNLVHEIGSHKDIIVTYIVEGSNTLLHLAAKLAPQGQLELVSGAAFQMSLELIWFEEVKKIMPPSFIKLRNSESLTAQELFTREHEELRKKAEDWMKRTAEFCMLISTVIATGVFSTAINIPGGIDDQTKKPNYLDKTSFLAFAISDATAFISSAAAILIFFSILISRYAEYDFHKSLPLKLIFGLITLFISITCMMVAFGSAFFITYNYGLKVVPDFISVLACLPMLLYIALQFSLWSDIIYSTYYCRTLFKPSKRMIYLLEK